MSESRDKVLSDVKVDVQTALASALTITAITKASPPVASFTGTDPVAGDYVVFNTVGMTELNGCVARVATVVAGTSFELEGLDSTSWGTFNSGSCQKITFGDTLDSAVDINLTGGDAKFESMGTVHNSQDYEVPNGYSAIKHTFSCKQYSTDAAQIALQAAAAARTALALKYTLADGSIMVQSGKIGTSGAPQGKSGGKVTTMYTFSPRRRPAFYAS